MKRSVWKIPYISPFFFRCLFLDNIKSFSRNSTISGFFWKKKILIYSGKFWLKVSVKKQMIGYKMGEFALTKILGSAISESMLTKSRAKVKSKSSKNK